MPSAPLPQTPVGASLAATRDLAQLKLLDKQRLLDLLAQTHVSEELRRTMRFAIERDFHTAAAPPPDNRRAASK